MAAVTAADDWDSLFPEWVRAACRQWSLPEPSATFYEKVETRLPKGLRGLICDGVRDELIVPKKGRFMLKGLPPNRTYSWFSHWNGKINPNWEYYVQIAEYVRLSHIAGSAQLSVSFEDRLMDVALWKSGERRPLVCVEVKEKVSVLQKLLREMKQLQKKPLEPATRVSLDSLKKAWYLVKNKPHYFCGAAIGARYEYSVEVQGPTFHLIEDVIPWA